MYYHMLNRPIMSGDVAIELVTRGARRSWPQNPKCPLPTHLSPEQMDWTTRFLDAMMQLSPFLLRFYRYILYWRLGVWFCVVWNSKHQLVQLFSRQLFTLASFVELFSRVAGRCVTSFFLVYSLALSTVSLSWRMTIFQPQSHLLLYRETSQFHFVEEQPSWPAKSWLVGYQQQEAEKLPITREQHPPRAGSSLFPTDMGQCMPSTLFVSWDVDRLWSVWRKKNWSGGCHLEWFDFFC